MSIDASFVETAAARLRKERESLCHQLKELGATESGELTGDVDFGDGFADSAAATAERTEVLGVADSLKQMLDGVDRALARIEEGLYGICVRCEKQIGAARLEFRPESTFCVDCKTKASCRLPAGPPVIHENTLIDAIAFIAILLPSVILHEVAHGWLADRFGDPTAREAGRLTLNPIPHIDPVGSLLVPGLLAASGATVFGWARPVPVQPARFRRPRETMALVALAGPATNLALAVLIGRLGPFTDIRASGTRGVELVSSLGIGLTSGSWPARLAFGAMVLNSALAVFNLLPIPPLDGSRLVPLVLPEQARPAWDRLSQYGLLVLLMLMLLFDGALDFVADVVGRVVRLAV